MKKIISVAILAAMLLSFGACDSGNSKPENTTQTTTASGVNPEYAATVITVDDINAAIDAAKKEYADATAEIKLSTGVMLSTDLKDPGITVESIKDGTATDEQMGNYAMYLANVRKLVCDRLITSFPTGNTVVFSTMEDNQGIGDFIILDPKAAGYDSAGTLLMDMSNKDSDAKIEADYVYINNSTVALFDSETEDVTLLCPSYDENAILAALTAKLNPDMLPETVAVTE